MKKSEIFLNFKKYNLIFPFIHIQLQVSHPSIINQFIDHNLKKPYMKTISTINYKLSIHFPLQIVVFSGKQTLNSQEH